MVALAQMRVWPQATVFDESPGHREYLRVNAVTVFVASHAASPKGRAASVIDSLDGLELATASSAHAADVGLALLARRLVFGHESLRDGSVNRQYRQ